MYMIMIYILCVFCSLVLYHISNKHFGDYRFIKLALSNFIIVYLILVLGVYLHGLFLEYKVNSFDLDGDGFFSDAETMAPDFSKYYDKLIGDAGRGLAPFIGLIFSFVYTTAYLIVIKLCQLFKELC